MPCRHATQLNATPAEVWAVLRDFHELSWAPNVVEKVDVIGDAGATEVGAKRVLNDAFHETLIHFDDAGREFRYSIDNGPGPLEGIDGYVGHVQVIEALDDGDDPRTIVVWNSDWAQDSTEVAEFCDPIYRALLGELRARFG